ncbi:MAG: Crp/Fnr family transcriptional regulator [Campylobacteraceae bacterium]|nr:Crp/Fnr family transcriptional regulator [Campylobacteraceae bacterium]
MKTHEIELFKNLNDTLKEEINRYSKLISFSKGNAVFDSYEATKYFYIFLSGRVKVYQINLENSKEQTIFMLGIGDMFDTITLLDGKIHEVITEVLENGEALKIPIEKVREWVNTNSAFNRIFFPYIANQMRKMEELSTELSLYDTSDRLIHLILKNLMPQKRGEKTLLQNLSRYEIASLIGTIRQVVDRHINELKNKGAIDTKRKNIIIKDIKKLLKSLKITA